MLSPQVVKSSVPSSSSRNQIGTTMGLPSSRVTASLPVRVPNVRNARISASSITRMTASLGRSDQVAVGDARRPLGRGRSLDDPVDLGLDLLVEEADELLDLRALGHRHDVRPGDVVVPVAADRGGEVAGNALVGALRARLAVAQ